MTYEEASAEMRGWLDLRALRGRYSNALVEQLARHYVDRTMHVHQVLDVIGTMQGTWKKVPLDRSGQFKHEPLKDLWKQHVFKTASLFQNLQTSVRALIDAARSRPIANQEIHEGVIGTYQRKSRARKLTGEWIVYAKDAEGRTHFLTLAKHIECDRQPGEAQQVWRKRSDALIYERVRACRADFPHLTL